MTRKEAIRTLLDHVDMRREDPDHPPELAAAIARLRPIADDDVPPVVSVPFGTKIEPVVRDGKELVPIKSIYGGTIFSPDNEVVSMTFDHPDEPGRVSLHYRHIAGILPDLKRSWVARLNLETVVGYSPESYAEDCYEKALQAAQEMARFVAITEAWDAPATTD